MWPGGAVARRRRPVSPSFYNSFDALDLYRNYPSYDTISPAYAAYNYGLGYEGLGLAPYVTHTQAIENLTQSHISAKVELEKAKVELEKAKEEYEKAKKKMDECEQKVKQTQDLLQAAKVCLS
jgi:hypothetical protein